MAVANAKNDRLWANFIDPMRVDIGTNDLLCQFSTFEDRFLVIYLKGIDNLHSNSECSALLGRILGELSSGVTKLPHVEKETAGRDIDSYNVGLSKSKIFVWVRWHNAGFPSGRISKHAVAGHLDVNGVRLTVAERARNDPFDSLASSSQALEWHAILGPHKAFIVAVPLKLKELFIGDCFGNS